MAARRNASGQFVKASKAAPRARAATQLARRPSASPARRSSPYAVASRRRRATGADGYAPVKSALAGAAIGTVETRFATTWAKLPEIGGSRMPVAAAILHLARGKIPHGSRLAESAATIAGYELGKSGKLLGGLGINGNGDDF